MDPWTQRYEFQSPYLYAYNNPIRYTDMLGLGAEDNVDDDDEEKKKEDEKKETEEDEKDEEQDVDIDDPDKPDSDLPSKEDSKEGDTYTDENGNEYVYLSRNWIPANGNDGDLYQINGMEYTYYNGRWIPSFNNEYTPLDYPLGFLFVNGVGWTYVGIATKAWKIGARGLIVGFISGGVYDQTKALRDYEKRYYTPNERKERSKNYEKTNELRLKNGGLDE